MIDFLFVSFSRHTHLSLLHLTTPYTRVSMMTHNFRHPQRSERGDLLSALSITIIRGVVAPLPLRHFFWVRRVCCTSHVTTR